MNRRQFGLICAAATAITALPRLARAEGAWDYTFEALEGGPMPLSQWRGKVLLVVNTASFCGFTPQYADLVEVWQDYRDRGLEVIGVPSNDFQQEYDEASKIKDFCELTYGVDFPMSSPVHVRGEQAHPFFKWAAAETGQRVRWNFNKYLVGRDGRIVAWMPSRLQLTTHESRVAIEAALAEPGE